MDAAAPRERGHVFAWRGLGAVSDLDLAFGGADGGADARGTLVTRLIASCCADPAALLATREADAWRLTLAGRIGHLAQIVARTDETTSVALAVRCAAHGCGERFEVALPLDAVTELAQAAERERTVRVTPSDHAPSDHAPSDHAPFRVRRPTGDDQRRWQQHQYAALNDAQRAILTSLLDGGDGGGALDDAAIARVGEAMDTLDPLPSFAIASACPLCGEDGEYAVDLEAVLVARLARWQRTTLREVHRLASRYGWSEDKVMALPTWRRRAYLAHVDADAGMP